jgi:hypothetical protein
MSSAIPHSRLKPFQAVRDELGADQFKAELEAGRWVAYWHDEDADELHEISQAHWLNSNLATLSMKSHIIFIRRDKNRASTPCEIFVVPAEAASRSAKRHPGGRPATYDWEGVLIHLARYIHDNGKPAKQAHLLPVMQKWFDEKGEIPAESEMKKRARRIFEEFKDKAENY